MTTKSNGVVTLNADNFEREVLQSDQPVLVDFWADWCQPCKVIGPVVAEIATEFAGIARVGKVDVDANKRLSQRYRIGLIPSLLFFKDGEIVDRVHGVVTKSELTRKLTALSASPSVENN